MRPILVFPATWQHLIPAPISINTYRCRDEILEQKAHPEANNTTPVKVQK
jgi:hypothetical protein